jgi:hypothetical protein
MSDRLKEICLEINRWMKTDPNSVKLKLLFAERQELLNRKRVNPTSFTLQYSERPKSKKRESNLVDFQKARAIQSAEEFSKSIENESLYEELRPKKKGLTDNIITL